MTDKCPKTATQYIPIHPNTANVALRAALCNTLRTYRHT